MVHALQMMESTLITLDDACRELNVPLLCARSYGLLGYLRVRGACQYVDHSVHMRMC